MKLISFSLTTPQFRAQTKSVTRRLGWRHLKAGDRLMGCEKVMGRRKGDPLVKLGVIIIHSVRFEPIRAMTDDPAYGKAECAKEGFPDASPSMFVAFFCDSHKGHPETTPETVVTRIAFRYANPTTTAQ